MQAEFTISYRWLHVNPSLNGEIDWGYYLSRDTRIRLRIDRWRWVAGRPGPTAAWSGGPDSGMVGRGHA